MFEGKQAGSLLLLILMGRKVKRHTDMTVGQWGLSSNVLQHSLVVTRDKDNNEYFKIAKEKIFLMLPIQRKDHRFR